MLFDVSDKGLLKRFDMKLEAGRKLKFFGDPINLILISKDQANVPKPDKNMKSLCSEIIMEKELNVLKANKQIIGKVSL